MLGLVSALEALPSDINPGDDLGRALAGCDAMLKGNGANLQMCSLDLRVQHKGVGQRQGSAFVFDMGVVGLSPSKAVFAARSL